MVAPPLPPQGQGPPQGAPPGMASPQGGPRPAPPLGPLGAPQGPVPNAPQGLPPAVAQAVQTVSVATGAPPEVVLGFLSFLVQHGGPQVVLSFMQLVQSDPHQAANVLHAWFLQQHGPPVPNGAGPAPPPGPLPGPPPQLLPPPPGPPGPGGPVSGPPPGMPLGPPPHMLQPPAPPKPPREKPPVKAPEPKVMPWTPAPIDKILKNSPFKSTPFTHSQVMGWKARAEKYWQPRNKRIEEMQAIIYRRPEFIAADGTPINPAEGELIHLRSKPARDFERYVSLAEPTRDRVRRQMKPRVNIDKCVDAAQLVENALRDQWDYHEIAWRERASLGDPQPLLPYKLMYLIAAQGGVGWYYRWNDGYDQEQHPYILTPVPWSELYPVDGVVTLRITKLSLAEARGQHPEIRDLYPKQDDDDRDEQGPSDQARVVIVACGDVWGQWWGLAWDFENPDDRTAHAPNDEDDKWIVPPQEVNYGFPFYRVLIARATGAPALGDDQDERIANTARGVLADRMGDIRMQDQLVSAMATGAVRAIDPPLEVYLDPQIRGDDVDEDGRVRRPAINRGIGGKTYLWKGEELRESQVDFSASRDVGNLLGMLGSDDNDASPAVLAGRDAAPSGFARALGSEAAAALYVDPLQHTAMELIRMVDSDTCVLLHRALDGDDALLTGLAVAGVNGEVELTAKDLEMAGNRTEISYRDNNMATILQRYQMYADLVQRGLINKELALDEMGFEEPELIQQAVLREEALGLQPFKEALIEQEVEDYGNAALTDKFQRALARNSQPPPGPPGMPSPPGGPPQGPGPTSMPGSSGVPPQMGG